MNLPALPADARLPRHHLVRVAAPAWAALMASRDDPANEPLLQGWAQRGWPLIVRRRLPGERGDASWLPLGLPLPPSAGKRRLALQVQARHIASVSALPQLCEVVTSAPRAWHPALRQLLAVGDRFGVQTRVFGSLAWQWLTGLDYLSRGSDIDLTWTLPASECIEEFLAAVADIDGAAPMRVDGELLRSDGVGVNWRELHARSAEVMLKTASDPLLCSRSQFLEPVA
ncbi:malonate decarboxylase holo-[acyl-carrier-protein] synthase [Variovorax sp. H27-G14]|uniref:malonate decarboxylase holo-[acyl-carrier-protein] synthase n=1 Tax=Variovorax sp. H27-G14 TaxID=3111914 RepID=UPI0038FCE3C0